MVVAASRLSYASKNRARKYQCFQWAHALSSTGEHLSISIMILIKAQHENNSVLFELYLSYNSICYAVIKQMHLDIRISYKGADQIPAKCINIKSNVWIRLAFIKKIKEVVSVSSNS